MKHIFLSGEIQVGKSTLINQVLERYSTLTLGGFYTKTIADVPGAVGTVYIMPAWDQKEKTAVGIRNTNGTRVVFPSAFDEIGTSILQKSLQSDLILMDEIGTMEADSQSFLHAILDIMEGDIPVFGVIKPVHTAFLNQVREYGEVFTITKQNRNRMLEEIDAALSMRIKKEHLGSFGAVILNGGDVLLVQMKSGAWGFPKGRRERGESGEAAAIREIQEETGLCVQLEPGFRRKVPSSRVSDKHDIHFFLSNYAGGRIILQREELKDAKFVPVEKAMKMISYQADQTVLEEALEFRRARL